MTWKKKKKRRWPRRRLPLSSYFLSSRLLSGVVDEIVGQRPRGMASDFEARRGRGVGGKASTESPSLMKFYSEFQEQKKTLSVKNVFFSHYFFLF